jgi:hypothetical protein
MALPDRHLAGGGEAGVAQSDAFDDTPVDLLGEGATGEAGCEGFGLLDDVVEDQRVASRPRASRSFVQWRAPS